MKRLIMSGRLVEKWERFTGAPTEAVKLTVALGTETEALFDEAEYDIELPSALRTRTLHRREGHSERKIKEHIRHVLDIIQEMH